jgi:hypothetical protein
VSEDRPGGRAAPHGPGPADFFFAKRPAAPHFGVAPLIGRTFQLRPAFATLTNANARVQPSARPSPRQQAARQHTRCSSRPSSAWRAGPRPCAPPCPRPSAAAAVAWSCAPRRRVGRRGARGLRSCGSRRAPRRRPPPFAAHSRPSAGVARNRGPPGRLGRRRRRRAAPRAGALAARVRERGRRGAPAHAARVPPTSPRRSSASTWAPPTAPPRRWRAASPPSCPTPRAAARRPPWWPSPRTATVSWARCAPHPPPPGAFWSAGSRSRAAPGGGGRGRASVGPGRAARAARTAATRGAWTPRARRRAPRRGHPCSARRARPRRGAARRAVPSPSPHVSLSLRARHPFRTCPPGPLRRHSIRPAPPRRPSPLTRPALPPPPPPCANRRSPSARAWSTPRTPSSR